MNPTKEYLFKKLYAIKCLKIRDKYKICMI